jgi:hypothetical protein
MGRDMMRCGTRSDKEIKKQAQQQSIGRIWLPESKDFLASSDRRSENVRVLTIVVTKLELGNIQRHIFAAHFMECADHAALEDRPEAFDCLCVDRADDILPSSVVNGGVREVFIKAFVSGPR